MQSPEMHPVNALLRFLLELAALVSYGYWGWYHYDGIIRWIFAIGLPLFVATLWGVFRIPGDASASGEAVVPVAGLTRLVLELAVFGFAALSLFSSEKFNIAMIFSGLIIVHYLSSIERIGWMLRQR